jgi:ABC-type lipopolysaccharide export system ATPase subunit
MLTTNNFIGIIIGTALPTTNFEDIQTVQVINTTTGQVISSSGNIGSTSITLNNETGQTYYPQDYSIIIIGSFIIS